MNTFLMNLRFFLFCLTVQCMCEGKNVSSAEYTFSIPSNFSSAPKNMLSLSNAENFASFTNPFQASTSSPFEENSTNSLRTNPENEDFSGEKYASEHTEEYLQNSLTSTSTGSVFAETSSSCHGECLANLEKMSFIRTPDSYFLKEDSSLRMECSVPISEGSSVRMIWLFQRRSPPTQHCSLTPQLTIQSCSGFAFEDHFLDSNFSAQYVKEVLTLQHLQTNNSGYYFCMVEYACCSGSHTMNKSLRTENDITIYSEDYTSEIIFLIVSTMVLFVLILVGIFLQRRRRKTYYKCIEAYDSFPNERILHVPILAKEDDDSFDESEKDE